MMSLFTVASMAVALAQIDFAEISADQDRVILTGIATILSLIGLLIIFGRRRRRRQQDAAQEVVTSPLPEISPEETNKTTLMSGMPTGALMGVEPQLIKGQQFLLKRPVTAIGRSRRDNHIRLEDASASRHHARIYVRDGVFIFRDLNSPNYNPSTVNGSVLEGEHTLESGDRIKIGTSVIEFIRLES